MAVELVTTMLTFDRNTTQVLCAYSKRKCFWSISSSILREYHEDDHALMRARQRLWTTNGSIVHPLGDVGARINMVECREGTTDSSTRALWQSYQQSFSSKAGGIGARNDEFGRTKFLCSHFERLTWSKILHGADGFTSPPKERVLRIFIALKNP
jgi:hypothetical protein